MQEGAEIIIPATADGATLRLGDHAVLQLVHTVSRERAPRYYKLEMEVLDYPPGKLHVLLDPVGDLRSFYRITLHLPEPGGQPPDPALSGAVLRRLRSGYTEDTRWDPATEDVRFFLPENSATPAVLTLTLRHLVPEDLLEFLPVLLRGNFVFEPEDTSREAGGIISFFGNRDTLEPLHPENFGLLQLCDDA